MTGQAHGRIVLTALKAVSQSPDLINPFVTSFWVGRGGQRAEMEPRRATVAHGQHEKSSFVSAPGCAHTTGLHTAIGFWMLASHPAREASRHQLIGKRHAQNDKQL